MTNRKIAQLAGVSPATVSKVFSGSSEISRETAERVRKIAEGNGGVQIKYHRNAQRGTNIKRVAILVPELISIFYSQTVTDIVNELSYLGAEASIYIIGFSIDKQNSLIDAFYDEGLTDGVISMATEEYSGKSDIPIVYLCETFGKNDYDMIYSDTKNGILDAVKYLIELGHTKIGFIGEKNTMVKSIYFHDAMSRLGCDDDPDYNYINDKRFEEIGYEAVKQMLSKNKMPTAFITAYDEVALGAIHAFQNNGISVPNDISIVGINDIVFSSYANIPLTTIRTYSTEKTRMAVKILMNKIDDSSVKMIQRVVIKCELIIRSTTDKVKEQ